MAAAILANAGIPAAGRDRSCHSSGVAGSPATRVEIAAIFGSFHPSWRVHTSTAPGVAANAASVGGTRAIARPCPSATERKASGAVERLPVLVVRPKIEKGAVAGGNKDGMRPYLEAFAKAGFVAVAIDARYHGDRADGKKGSERYVEAVTAAWGGTLA